MKIINLQAENFKILKAIEITPEGNIVKIGGNNGQGKSSVLDAVWVALAGKAVAPPKPIRKGEEQCRLRLDLGELVITRTFTQKEGDRYTDTVKVESGDGRQRYNAPQGMLDDLMGSIGFDPFAFVQRKAEDQAAMLLELVPLPIDLEAMAREDAADYANRRDKNRDAEALRGQIAAIPLDESVPAEPIDREAIVAELGSAADKNTAIERERMSREERQRTIDQRRQQSAAMKEEADALLARIQTLRSDAGMIDAGTVEREEELAALPPLDEPVDTAAVRQRLTEAEETNRLIERQAQRRQLATSLDALTKEAQALTDAMADRERGRKAALASAKMPIEGLGFAINEKGKPVVELGGVPFEQASTADQIRASTAIAMSSNPELRVLRIKDGSLLDDASMAIITKMAEDEDYQLWVEVVGTGAVGIVIEDGAIKGATGKAEGGEEKSEAAPADKGKSKAKPAAEAGPAGPLL